MAYRSGGAEQLDDLVLARRAGLGDRVAFGVIARRHGPAMYRLARRTVLDDGDAEEAVQDALLAAWWHLSDFRGAAALRSWLLRLTLNKAHNVRRKRRPVPREAGEHETEAGIGSDPAHDIIENELVAALGAALAGLPEPQRVAWLLREVDQLSYEEIAAVMDTSRDVVRGLLHRARHRLAERLAPWR
ncbi:RNA polymerase sigma factor [Jiangella endophytica]|uniref:RNA polymerase sigma factor n=1 Tax=Jiangella endophytica TaxID=1623398 RepID=UPI000E346AA6|nr:sigma-70 family RNA polymerase sigma factor [Jiangella endophytica]